jgi:hypothetical protein
MLTCSKFALRIVAKKIHARYMGIQIFKMTGEMANDNESLTDEELTMTMRMLVVKRISKRRPRRGRVCAM